MLKQIIFSTVLLITIGFFLFTIKRIYHFFQLTKPAFPVKNFGKRIKIMLNVAFGQTKIFRLPVIGLIHALVFWGFCVILFGSMEMVIDGISGSERVFGFLGPIYDIIIASGDVFALCVGFCILIFLFRRVFLHIKRFQGIEMKHISHLDANIALSLILLLMVSLTGMNAVYYKLAGSVGKQVVGLFPCGQYISKFFEPISADNLKIIYEIFWWSHILLIFLFANILPYSKHFHVFMSIPNVFLSRLDPLGKLPNMGRITQEVKLMLDPSAVPNVIPENSPIERFGIRDAEDISWKNYFDSLACTECGRCTSVCPANLTGKRLSPRKIMMDVRARMKEKGPGLVKNGIGYTDNKSLIRDFILEEEVWACTTCNACARECPININHPTLIIDLRRYLVMEEASAPGGLKGMFNNIENNGAPWQYSSADRLRWTENLEIKVN